MKADIDHMNENFTNFSNTLPNLKVEVRYSSITLFDINTNLQETAKLLQHHNDSMENIKSDMADNEQNQSAALLELGKQHMRFYGKCITFLKKYYFRAYSFYCVLPTRSTIILKYLHILTITSDNMIGLKAKFLYRVIKVDGIH